MTLTGRAEALLSRHVVGRGLAKRAVFATAPAWDPLHVAWYRRRHGFVGPVPPFANRRRVGAWTAAAFVEGGRQAHDDLAQRIVGHTGRHLAELSVLDLGSGPGRIAQYFEGEVDHLSVCDVDPTAVGYLSGVFAGLTARVSSSNPPLPFEARSFDVLYCWSILTHLPEQAQSAYISEMARLLRPGGWALVTVNGHAWLDQYQAFPRAEQAWRGVSHDELRAAGLMFRDFPPEINAAQPGVTGAFGLTFHDPSWIRAHWRPPFEVVAIEEGAMHNGQDLVVLHLAEPADGGGDDGSHR